MAKPDKPRINKVLSRPVKYERSFIRETFEPGPAIEYLLIYLKDLEANSVWVEDHYVDRHYLEDYAGYYVYSFKPLPEGCKRLHFFRTADAELAALFKKAHTNSDARSAVEQQIHEQEHYLGFCVVRPFRAAKMGRMVLRTYPVAGRRHYGAVRPYEVNVDGLKLTVRGLAYQQQDGGVAVCASTALWSALQRVAHVAGRRTPAPSKVTAASATPYPAGDGLTDLQMATALSKLGYIADYFAPKENRPLFKAKVCACLQSGLPVLLLLAAKQQTGAGEVTSGHAITLTGYSEPHEVADIFTVNDEGGNPIPPIRMRSGSLVDVYAHDDNLGSHAHYQLFDSEDKNTEGHKKLMLRRGLVDRPIPKWTIDEWEVETALVPKTEWHRLPIKELIFEVLAIRPLCEELLPGLSLEYSTRFESGVDFKRNRVYEHELDPRDFEKFIRSLSLPRFIGVIECWGADQLLLAFLVDVSEVDSARGMTILGAMAPGIRRASKPWVSLRRVSKNFGHWPVIGAPKGEVEAKT